MCHPFFDELRSADAKVASNGKAVPELFNFTKEGSSIFSLGVIKVFLLITKDVFNRAIGQTGSDQQTGATSSGATAAGCGDRHQELSAAERGVVRSLAISSDIREC